MSAGARPDRRGQRTPRRQHRFGPDKPARRGLSRLPEVAWPVLIEILEEEGLAGLVDACGALHLSVRQAARLQHDPAEPSMFVSDGDQLVVPGEAATRLERLGATLAAVSCGDPGAWVARRLHGPVSTKLRRRLLPEHPWAAHVWVTVRLLRQRADELAVEQIGARPEYLRAYTRSAYAHVDELRPATTRAGADLLDAGLATFWNEVDAQLTPRARAALARVRGETW